MKNRNIAIFRPPGDPEGFGADNELLERAAKLILFEYALLPNVRKGSIGYLPAPSDSRPGKKWYRNLNVLNHHMIVEAMKNGKRCYGVAHKRFSNLLIFDVDNPELGDEDLIEGGLRAQGWLYKKFHSGRGRHFWIFFNDLPHELLALYGNGPAAMKAVAETFRSGFMDYQQGIVDIRGCTGALIKLPLQFDPYHGCIVMPFDGENELITDFKQAVDFAANIQRNDPQTLIDFLATHGGGLQGMDSSSHSESRSRGSASMLVNDVDGNFQQWLDTVRVGPGESNDFMFHFVLHCKRTGLSQQETIDTAKELYERGRADGRITCKDSWPEWKSKAEGRIKKLWSIKGSGKKAVEVRFWQGDLEWLSMHASLTIDPLFLAAHLWARRLSRSDEYFLSRRTAEECGITPTQFRKATKRFQASGLLKILTPGKSAPVRKGKQSRATAYRLLDYPEPSGSELSVRGPYELAAAYVKYRIEGEIGGENTNM